MIILIKVVPGVQSLKQKAHTVVDSKHHVCFSLMRTITITEVQLLQHTLRDSICVPLETSATV